MVDREGAETMEKLITMPTMKHAMMPPYRMMVAWLNFICVSLVLFSSDFGPISNSFSLFFEVYSRDSQELLSPIQGWKD